MAKIMRQSHARHFGQRARHFNSNCSCAHECKGQLAADLFGGRVFDRGHFFGSFERTQYSAADEVGIIEGFEAGREVPPFVVAIIVVLNASREDKEVVGQLTATQMDDASAGVDAYDFIQENVNVVLMTEDRAQRTEVSSAESRPVATW